MDSVVVGVDSTYPPHVGRVEVRFCNDQPLLGVEVTLRTMHTAVTIDSVCFDDSRVQGTQYFGWTRDDSSGAVTIFAFSAEDGPIPSGSGLLAALELAYPDSLQGRTVAIDSTTILIDLIERTTGFTDTTMNGFVPQFSPGSLIIEPPCCQEYTGNVDKSIDGVVDIGDLTLLITHLFIDFDLVLPCPEAGNIDGDIEGIVDIGDLTILIGYLFIDAETNAPAACL